nr:hypothetical protein [Tanacetum cinerariifolium]
MLTVGSPTSHSGMAAPDGSAQDVPRIAASVTGIASIRWPTRSSSRHENVARRCKSRLALNHPAAMARGFVEDSCKGRLSSVNQRRLLGRFTSVRREATLTLAKRRVRQTPAVRQLLPKEYAWNALGTRSAAR